MTQHTASNTEVIFGRVTECAGQLKLCIFRFALCIRTCVSALVGRRGGTASSVQQARTKAFCLRRADTLTDLQRSLVGTDVRAAAAELKCSICMLISFMKHAVLCLNATANDRDGLSSIVQIVATAQVPLDQTCWLAKAL